MNASFRTKWRGISPWVIPGVIVDVGCGTGIMLRALAHRFPTSPVVGIERSRYFAQISRSATDGFRNVTVTQGDAAASPFASGILTTKICSTLLHEVFSYARHDPFYEPGTYSWAGDRAVRQVFAQSFRELVPGGRLIIRDGVRPDIRQVALWLRDDDGVREPENDIRTLSTQAMFRRFAQDFEPVRTIPLRPFPAGKHDTHFSMLLDDAYEFLMKKDYRENWNTEIRELFGYWTKQCFEEALVHAGFNIIHSRLTRNPWIMKNRITPAARLYAVYYRRSAIKTLVWNKKLKRIPFPATHILIVAEKPNKKTPKLKCTPFSGHE